jgi:hypothetical protein
MTNQKLLLKEIILFSLMLILNYPLYSQLSVEGITFGLAEEFLSKISDPVWIEMENVDVDALKEEDKILDTVPGIPYRFGENLYVDLNPKNSGVWDLLDDGSKIWRLGIISRGAVSINLAFNRYRLPEGARLFVYTPDGKYVIGAFTELNNQNDGYFATDIIPGDRIIIEYFEPAKAEFSGELNLWRITHGYRGFREHKFITKGFGDSGNCQINVACQAGNNYRKQIRSVALIIVGNTACSGALINNTANNEIPYFLTANHCYSHPSTAVIRFNYQSTTCQNPGQEPSFNSLSGAVTRARHDKADFWLLQLNQSPPWDYNTYYSGWNRTTQSSIQGVVAGIHHPQADIKKISRASGVNQTGYGMNNFGSDYWRVAAWYDNSATEPGSSGSPLFDPHLNIIGQLRGGLSACGNSKADWYGSIGASWTGGGTNGTRLRNWLDPNNSGVVVLGGYDPRNIIGPNIVCSYQNSTFYPASLPPNASVSWTFSPSNLVTPSSGSGTSATFQGLNCTYPKKGTLTFTISRSGYDPDYLTKEIMVNGPDYSDVEFDVYYTTGQKAPKQGDTWLLCSQTNYHIYFTNTTECWTSNYSWTIPTGWSLNYQYQNMISINTNTSPGGNVQVRGQTCCTACGSNVPLFSDYFGQYWSCSFGSFSIYPNPASDYFEIDIVNDQGDDEIISLDGEFNVTIADNMGIIKYADRFREFPHRINTVNLTKGIYIITISFGGNSSSIRVLIDN